ncbi:MAG: DNA glycosylase AlkZ-like family protein, partial [Micromonosporaceae bacterium]
MRHIDVAERRARLLRRHLLAPDERAADPAEAAAGVVVLHATDPASVYLQALARMREPDVAAVERALYDDRTLVRMLGMRRTMFVAPVGLAPVVQAAATRA